MNAAPLIRVTPVVDIPPVRARIGPVVLKLEGLQRTGSFKLRGAVHKLASLSEAERGRGVVAASAGNHGAGVALAGVRMGVAVSVVVPVTAPANKRERIASLGARVVVEGAGYDEAEAEARRLARETGAVFVSPFDDDAIIEGNGGGLGAELLRQVPDMTQVVCPVGGGGLIGGLAARLAPEGVRVVGVQPRNNCAMHDSMQHGRALTTYQGGATLAEGCEGAVAERTYALVRAHVDDIALVSEAAIRRAVAFCYRVAGTIVECTAAVALAGFIEGALRPARSGVTVCVLTGSNIEPDLLDAILAEFP